MVRRRSLPAAADGCEIGQKAAQAQKDSRGLRRE
jgi:hypothetical protein